MLTVAGTSCCGLKEIQSIGSHRDPEEMLRMVGRAIFNDGVRAAFYIFTDKGYLSKGARLRNYIRWHGLGVVTESPARKNPNSSNRLTVWIWAYNPEAFEAWWNAHKRPEDRAMCRYCNKPKPSRGTEPVEGECKCCDGCGEREGDCVCDNEDLCGRCERHYDDCECCGRCESLMEDCECCSICDGWSGDCGCCRECENTAETCTCCKECENPQGHCSCKEDEPLSTTPTV